MTKREFIREIARNAGITINDASTFTNAFIDTMLDCIRREGSVNIPAFGVFCAVDRPEGEVTHPVTRLKVRIPAKKIFKFKASKTLKV
ncbi:MAG: HU family DNA-binding protein [Fusobacteriaceae bacterium]